MIAGFAKLVGRDHWPPPAVSASLASSLEASMGAFPDQIALELGKRAEDVEHQHPARRGGVDLLGERAETHAARRQIADFLDQVARRAPKTIEFQTTSVSPVRR